MSTEPIFEQFEPRLLLDGAGVIGVDLLAEGNQNVAAEFVRAEGTEFKLGEDTFYAPGTNNYYLLSYAGSKSTRQHVDEVLEDAAAMGLKVIRAWAFNDGAGEWNALQTAPGQFAENVFKGLDYVIYKAGQLGLRLILPFVNYWGDYGGMDQYVAWDARYGTDRNQVASKRSDFYTDSDTKQWYKDFVSALVNRRNSYTEVLYKDDPTIFSWELANEPRVPGDKSGKTLQTWMTEMAAYVKSVDPNHMLTTGIEGFYSFTSSNWMYDGSEGTDFIANHQVEGIDFATVHLYPDQWGISYSQSLSWYKRHIDDARDILHMPLLLEEFGLQVKGSGSRAERDKLYQGLFDMAEQTGAAGWNFWMLAHNGYKYGNYNVFYPDEYGATTVDIITEAAAKMTGQSFAEPAVQKAADLTATIASSTLPTIRAANTRFKGKTIVRVANEGNLSVRKGTVLELRLIAVSTIDGKGWTLLKRTKKIAATLAPGGYLRIGMTINRRSGLPAGNYILKVKVRAVRALKEQNTLNNDAVGTADGNALTLECVDMFADIEAMIRNGTYLTSRSRLALILAADSTRTRREWWDTVTGQNRVDNGVMVDFRNSNTPAGLLGFLNLRDERRIVSTADLAVLRQIRRMSASQRRNAYSQFLRKTGGQRVPRRNSTWRSLSRLERYLSMWRVLSGL